MGYVVQKVKNKSSNKTTYVETKLQKILKSANLFCFIINSVQISDA